MEQELINQTKQEISRLMKEQRYAEAMPLVRQAAHWGDIESQMMAADAYTEGLYGMLKNPYAAFEYVKLAALNDQPFYMYELGNMFLNGKGTGQDLEKAFYFLNKAALRDQKEAYDPLAMMFATGKGTKRGLAQAQKWIEKAAEAEPEDEQVIKHQQMIQKLIEKYGI